MDLFQDNQCKESLQTLTPSKFPEFVFFFIHIFYSIQIFQDKQCQKSMQAQVEKHQTVHLIIEKKINKYNCILLLFYVKNG